MDKITFFAIPKAFEGHFNIIQRNALQSWLKSEVVSEVVLFGDDAGVDKVCTEFSLQHRPEVKKNEFGTPLIGDVFEQAQRFAKTDVVCYINSDILITKEFDHVFSQINTKEFLMVGRRWDLDITEFVDFSDLKWQQKLYNQLEERGKLHSHTGIDYFVFSKGLYEEIPPFAVGRTSWDNWLIYKARAQGVPVLDATEGNRVVHQNHGYPESFVRGGRWKGPEAARNLALAGDLDYCFTIKNADWQWHNNSFQKRKFKLAWGGYGHFLVLRENHQSLGRFVKLLLRFRRWTRRLVRWVRTFFLR